MKKVFFLENIFQRADLSQVDKTLLTNHFSYVDESYFQVPTNKIIRTVNKLNFMLTYDQSIRSIRVKNECKDQLIFQIDSLNYQFVKDILNDITIKREFLGSHFVKLHFLLLHTTVALGMDKSLSENLKQKVFKGQYNNSAYARLIDRYYTWYLDKPQIYGSWMENYLVKDVFDFGNIDMRRSEICLMSYEKFKEINYVNYICQ